MAIRRSIVVGKPSWCGDGREKFGEKMVERRGIGVKEKIEVDQASA